MSLLGPAFIAAIAYVDPGNVAANISSGATYGYLLVWVLAAANLMAMIVQYQAAKLGIVTGKSLPQLLGQRLSRPWRIAYWLQAEIVAAATDLAEIIGGAVALHLLFGVSPLTGGIIVGAVSMALLLTQGTAQKVFERVIIVMLVIITFGFLAGLFFAPPNIRGIAGGLVPRFEGSNSVILAASMLGATVMPHVIYLHSSLVIHRHGAGHDDPHVIRRLLKATRIDIIIALGIAGLVNIGLLLLAASALSGRHGTDTIEGAHSALSSALGPAIGVIFAIGLLFSGLASTSVGAYAGSEVMKGMLHFQVKLWIRRAITLIPALLIIAFHIDATYALVISQVVLSVGIPFALIPLQIVTGGKVMGQYRDKALKWIGAIISALIISLNIVLIVMTVRGQA
ncbi:Nramp family divalent metal transporter [Corynebacterium kroppenstedtii]|nr:Nramp family divalent metal transporter [Corynebacterium kroppenstedtii]